MTEPPVYTRFALFALGILVVAYAEIRRYFVKYHFKSDRVREERGVFKRSVMTVRFERVTQVSLNEGPIERMMGIGDLEIDTAGKDTTELKLRGIKNPEEYREIIGKHTSDADAGTVPQEKLTSKERLESELGRIEREQNKLEESYNNGEIDEGGYQERWYVLKGRRKEVEELLDRLEDR